MEDSTAPLVPVSRPAWQRQLIVIISLVLIVGLGIFWYARNAVKPDLATPSQTPTQNTVSHPAFSQAPVLAAQVIAGTLPPVENRMPANPVIVAPTEKIGVYGGTWHLAMDSTSDSAIFVRTIGAEALVRWNVQATDVIPNIAQSYEVSGDSREYTFHLRKEMKWSDGQPFNADDILFWYESIFSNPDFAANKPAYLTPAGEPVVVSKIDDFTVRFTFKQPDSLFLQNLAAPLGIEPTSYPKHILQQYVPAYNPHINTLIAQEKVTDAAALFKKKFGAPGALDTDRWQHPEIPTLNAWTLTAPYTETAKKIVADRNPYYWKIDPAGNQLPYIDHVEYAVNKSDADIIPLIKSGYIDMQDRHISAAETLLVPQSDLPSIYTTYQTVFSSMNSMIISLNLTHKDPILGEIFQNKDFRIALSEAINRQEIIDQVFGGRGTPYQAAPRPESAFYDEGMAHQYTQYDPQKANTILDAAGYAKKDAQGYRLRPDGKRISFIIDWGIPKALTLLQGYWKQIGIDLIIGNTTDRTAYYTKKANNDLDAGVWAGDGGIEVLNEPRYYFPFSIESNFAIPWALWFNNPKDPLAQQPPQAILQQQSLYRQMLAVVGLPAQTEIMKKILAISADQFYAIGISLPSQGFGIRKTTFHNVPALMISAYTYSTPAYTNPCQYYIQ